MTGDIKVAFRLGGADITVPPLTFGVLKRSWPLLERAQVTKDNMEMISAMIGILSAALIKQHPDLTTEEIEDRLLVDEMEGLRGTFEQLLAASGFIKPEGKDGPAASEPSSSMAISTESSPS